MVKDRGKRRARIVGIAVGLSLAAVAMTAWRVPAGSGRLGLDVSIIVNKTGELDVSPAGVLLHESALERSAPQRAPQGQTTITNQTPSGLEVRARALPSTDALDDLLYLRLTTSQRTVFEGPLARLKLHGSSPFDLEVDAATELQISAWLPSGSSSDYRGRIVDVTITLEAEPKES